MVVVLVTELESEDSEVLAVAVAEDKEFDDGTADPAIYIFKRPGPPQYSVWFLVHVILQSVDGAFIEPAARLLPQKHCPPYSTPE